MMWLLVIVLAVDPGGLQSAASYLVQGPDVGRGADCVVKGNQ